MLMFIYCVLQLAFFYTLFNSVLPTMNTEKCNYKTTHYIIELVLFICNFHNLLFKVLELNASDDRGINVVRGQIMNFASTRTIFKSGHKLIILDEADAMTNDAQNALRRSNTTFLVSKRLCLT